MLGKLNFEKQDFACIKMSESLVFRQTLPHLTGSKIVFLEMKHENFSCRSLQLCLVSPISTFVPKAKTKNLRPFRESRPDCLCMGAGKSSKLPLRSGFLDSLSSFPRWHAVDGSQCGSRAELKDADLKHSASRRKALHPAYPHTDFALHRVSEVRNSKRRQGLFKP